MKEEEKSFSELKKAITEAQMITEDAVTQNKDIYNSFNSIKSKTA